MKIVFTGGGTGGHFYPIIAVAEEIAAICRERKLVMPDLYYFAPSPYDPKLLYEHNIEFRKAPAGKLRKYASVLNVIDMFKTGAGIIRAIFLLFSVYPDIVFSKGGYAAFPTVFAARILRVPVIIHDSDSVPGRVNLWSGKFAKRIALAYPDAAEYFKTINPEAVALVGNPVRKSVERPAGEGAANFLELDGNTPTLLFIGGSQGAQHLNEVLIDALPDLLERFQVIHQTGAKNFKDTSGTARVALEKHAHKDWYKPFPYLNDLAMRMAAGLSLLVVSRAGSGGIFEIAAWGRPAILIPLGENISRDQTHNAFAFARAGGALVIEENNLTPHVLVSEINRLFDHPELLKKMAEKSKGFYNPKAARIIAEELIDLALEHENS